MENTTYIALPSQRLAMTFQGEEKVKQALRIVEEVDHTFFASLPEGVDSFITLLRHLLAKQ